MPPSEQLVTMWAEPEIQNLHLKKSFLKKDDEEEQRLLILKVGATF